MAPWHEDSQRCGGWSGARRHFGPGAGMFPALKALEDRKGGVGVWDTHARNSFVGPEGPSYHEHLPPGPSVLQLPLDGPKSVLKQLVQALGAALLELHGAPLPKNSPSLWLVYCPH